MLQPDVNAGGLAVGTVLGETYELVRLIGQGGMGAVWEASHLRLPGKRVAVKVLLATIAAGSEAFSRFRREAEIASRLGHANIVEVFDFNVLPSGTPYLVLELLQGESLAQRLRRGPLPPGEALAVTRQIGAALSAAHRHGVVHRDLKPDNVYLCPPTDEGATLPRVKVLDFGISKIAGSSTVQTQEARVMGTPQYMAPEQFTGIDVDARSDLYALGVILYQAVTGTTPFDGPSASAIFELQRRSEPPPFERARPGFTATRRFEQIVFKLLAKKPDERFASARALADALEFRFEPTAEVTRKSPNPLPPEDPRDLARDKIQRTIQRGAPLYNGGDSEGCAQLYLRTSEELISRELAGRDQAVLRLRLSAAVQRAFGREAQGAAWELRYGFDDLLFALGESRRQPVTPVTRADRKRESRFAAGCPGLSSIRRELDLAALVAARRYDAGHADVVGDYFLLLAQELTDRLGAELTCKTVLKRLSDGLEDARQSASRVEAAAILGDAFDEVRFDGSSEAAPPAEAAVLAASEQIEEVGNALLDTIREGSALYNAGDIEGCARVYLASAQKLDAGLRPGARNAPLKRLFETALEKARSGEPDDVAWTLRRAFDAVLEAWRIAHNPSGVSAVKRDRA
jgi:serine/threonine-protein kinase